MVTAIYRTNTTIFHRMTRNDHERRTLTELGKARDVGARDVGTRDVGFSVELVMTGGHDSG